MVATEMSMASSMHGARIVEFLPFLRTRYGRSSVYIVSGMLLMIFNSDTTISSYADLMVTFGGMILGLIAMQPGNPLDYRGFQRPSGQNDLLSRMQTAGAQSFDSMAA